MLVDLTEDEIAGILTYMWYGINECGEITNDEQNAYTKLYKVLKGAKYKFMKNITKPKELTEFNAEAEAEDE